MRWGRQAPRQAVEFLFRWQQNLQVEFLQIATQISFVLAPNRRALTPLIAVNSISRPERGSQDPKPAGRSAGSARAAIALPNVPNIPACETGKKGHLPQK